MNEYQYLTECVEALKYKKIKYLRQLSKIYSPEYFVNFKDNPFDDWGKLCLALKEAQKRKQDYLDVAEKNFVRL